jgi:hypothetical protein
MIATNVFESKTHTKILKIDDDSLKEWLKILTKQRKMLA